MLACCRFDALKTLATTRAKTCFLHNSTRKGQQVIPAAPDMEKSIYIKNASNPLYLICIDVNGLVSLISTKSPFLIELMGE
jgi:hypothetical protein